VSAPFLDAIGDDVIDGQLQRHATPHRVGLDVASRIELVVFHERFADRNAARLEERVRHRAADDQAVDLAEHVLDDVDLVRHFRAAEDDDERPLRRLERVAEIAELLFHQESRGRAPEVAGDRVDRRVRAVRRAERVVHVLVGQRRQLLGECRIVVFLFGMKAQVFEKNNSAACLVYAIDGLRGVVADAVFGERDRLAEHVGEASGDGPETHLRIRFPLGPAEMTREDGGRALLERVGDRRQRRLDARVVADRAILDRHVEVDPDENAFSPELEVLDRKLHRPAKAFALQTFLDQQAKQINTATRVAPLVVVPGEDFDEIAVHHLRVGCVDDRRMRVALEIDRHELLG